MEIRKEEPKDYAEIYEVVKRAFNSAEQSDDNRFDCDFGASPTDITERGENKNNPKVLQECSDALPQKET